MEEPRCGFCGKAKNEVHSLIAGVAANICDECIVRCMDIIQEAGLAATGVEGQLLARFPDGVIRACEQTSAWNPFVHDAEDLAWCVATAGDERVVLVRLRMKLGAVLGASVRDGDERDAHRVLDAHGGVPSLAPRSTKTKVISRKVPLPFELPPGFISDQEIANFLSQQYRIPTINLTEYEIDREILALVPADVCRRLVVLPVSRAGSSLILAVADPTNEAAKTEIAQATRFNVEPVIASEGDITKAIDRYYGDT